MRIERASIKQMQSTVEEYIYQKKGVRVTIDIERDAKWMPAPLNIRYLQTQLKKLNIAYTVAKAYLEGH